MPSRELPDSIVTLCESIWTQTLGLPLTPAPTAASPDASLTLEGCVHIHGEWCGLVLVQCSLPLAWLAATKMFQLGDQAPSEDEVRDAVGELTNIIGGNIKALLPGADCDLSLPVVIEGRDFSVRVPGARIVADQRFTSQGEWMVVSVLEAFAAAA
jgi:chemotaxis protein CheX